ncbi:helix-turn-helix transcriptional regulator [Asanoa sp. WMMD1127]|uniref:helix-turn-helix transcriptional regulator n=1 Tax=Asanoa sp. WMMD1127 TaxID=3016107 RepID=UPI00241693C6|nr:helix-turn-helix transcriptional regulator [Asanoa sp. WMMD1127]MDG4824031.1 helix-turn-helix transcriptional regulator [Asanoa sp. WMMD1127]
MQISALLRGRARELAAIGQLLRRAADGAGGALVLEGDPGSGRSALLAHAVRQAPGFDRIPVLGLPGETDLPYAALHRLPVPPPVRRPRTADQRLRLCTRVLDAVVARSRRRPVLVVVDDADLVDPPSLEVLAFVARRCGDHAVAMVFAGAAGPPVDGAALRLAPLDPATAGDVLADHGLGGPLAEVLVGLARGNPAALHDLIRALTPEQRRGAEPPPAGLPADGALRRAYRTRLRSLPPATRRALLLVALDDALDPAVLARLGGGALAAAERAGLVRGTELAHPAVREVIRDEATLAERQRAHRTLARLLTGDAHRLRRLLHLAAATPPPNAALADEIERAAESVVDCRVGAVALERAAELSPDAGPASARRVAAARYAWLGGDPARARRLLARSGATGSLLAGEIALRGGTAGQALELLLAAADELAPARPDQAWRALVLAGEAVCLDGDHGRYREVLRRAVRLRRAGLVEPVRAAQVAGLAAVLRGDHERGRPALRSVLELSTSDPDVLISAAAAGLLLGDDTAAHRALERAAELARSSGAVALLPRALELRTFVEYWMGCYGAAAASAAEGVAVARACGQASTAGNLVGLLAVLAALRGDAPECMRWMRELRSASPASRPRALVQWALAVLDLVAGRAGDALRRLVSMADPASGSGTLLIQMTATPHLVEAAATAGDPEAGRSAAEVYDRWAAATGDPTRRALAARCRALLAPRGGAEAVAAFEEALRLHPADGGDFERARTELLLGRELRRARHPRDARPHLHRAAEGFALVDMPVWAAQANAELRAAGDACDLPASLPPGPGLTAQQQRIAHLVAAGATNREVAAQLFLSTRTVDHHLRNIFSRLGVRSRTELARVI